MEQKNHLTLIGEQLDKDVDAYLELMNIFSAHPERNAELLKYLKSVIFGLVQASKLLTAVNDADAYDELNN